MTGEPVKPLHVQVAEALGWTGPREESGVWYARLPEPERERGCPCRGSHCCPDVPRYDTDWSATGPLIERHRFALDYDENVSQWVASVGIEYDDDDWEVHGTTPLLAACSLILTLKAAGRMPLEPLA